MLPKRLCVRKTAKKDAVAIDRPAVCNDGAPMKTYMCLICGFLYSEAEGDPDAGLPPGTRWDDVPLSWRCPDCGAGKEDFDMVEV